MIPSFDYHDLCRVADGFLARYHTAATVPVPIEEIIDLHYQVNIVPVPGLQDVEETVGLSDFSTIFVDKFIYEKRLNRYRFTLAHEISHQLIHKEMFLTRPFNTVDEWKVFVTSLDPVEHKAYERQADQLAGLIFCPTDHLRRSFEAAKKQVTGSPVVASVSDETLIEAMAGSIAKEFVVASSTVEIRLKLEGWSPRD